MNTEARLLKARIKQASVNDVGAMSLNPCNIVLSSKYFVALLNSNIIFDYYREFVNCSVNIQINDIRQLPIVIPDKSSLVCIESIVDKAIACRKLVEINYTPTVTLKRLKHIEQELDQCIGSIYFINMSH